MILPVAITERALPAQAPAPAAAPAADGKKATDPAIVDAAKKMEGVFMSMLVDQMFKGTGLTGDQPVYAGMITEHLGDALADAGGMGLAAMLTRQMEGTR